jgi:hypothetical protein
MDTDMQIRARSRPPDVLPTVEVFKGFQRDRRLAAAAVTASKISPGSSSAMWSTAAPAAVTSSEHRPIADQGRCQGMSPARLTVVAAIR